MRKVTGDVISIVAGVGESIFGIIEIITSVAAGGATTVLAGGTLVLGGVSISVAGVTLGAAVAVSAVASLGSDWDNFMLATGNGDGSSDDGGKNKITKSEHAQIRSEQGRNVNTAINDVQNSRLSDILIQDDGRWVVRGDNGRVHILEQNGEIVTAMNNVSNYNVQQRIIDGRWSRLTLGEESIFKNLFSNYVNWR